MCSSVLQKKKKKKKQPYSVNIDSITPLQMTALNSELVRYRMIIPRICLFTCFRIFQKPFKVK